MNHRLSVVLSFPVQPVFTSPPPYTHTPSPPPPPPGSQRQQSLRQINTAHTSHTYSNNRLVRGDKTVTAPDLNLPLQMDGVSTSRQAMVDSAGVLGGQLWSPIWSGEAGDDQGRRGGRETSEPRALRRPALSCKASLLSGGALASALGERE